MVALRGRCPKTLATITQVSGKKIPQNPNLSGIDSTHGVLYPVKPLKRCHNNGDESREEQGGYDTP